MSKRPDERRELVRRSGRFFGIALVFSAGSRAMPEPLLKWALLAIGLVPLAVGISLFFKGLRAAKAGTDSPG